MRLKNEDYFIAMAQVVSMRSTCTSRIVGCVLVDSNNFVLSTGYNGGAAGLPHCCDTVCNRKNNISGDGLDSCEAIHAEQNALLQCNNTQEIEVAYITASPCVHCIKLLMNTSCKRIIFKDIYPGYEELKYKWENSTISFKRVMKQLDYIKVEVIYDKF